MTAPINISVLIPTKNEEKNIRKCLSSLSPATEIIVVDSGSVDDSSIISQEEFGATVLQFAYSGGYPKKRQWVLDHYDFKGDWILLLDADEVIPDALWEEISSVVTASGSCDAYLIQKGFHFLGRRFRYGGFSHRAVSLFRKGKGNFEELFDGVATSLDMEVHERLIVDGKIGRLKTPLIHEDFKGLQAYIDRHNAYSSWEAGVRCHYLKTGRYGGSSIGANLFGNVQERRRLVKSIIIRLPLSFPLWKSCPWRRRPTGATVRYVPA